MGMKGNSGYFLNTNSFKFKLDLQFFAELPSNKSQLNHILRNSKGHLIDTPQNRALLISLSNDKDSYLGKDKRGNEWFAKEIGDKQLWVKARNGIIQNGGLNEKKVKYVINEGLKTEKYNKLGGKKK